MSSHDATQVDLIDMQSFPDGDFKYIMVYQDHGAKFCMLSALKDKKRATVVLELLSIFATLAPPFILQSDNGREFANVAGSGALEAVSDEDLDGIVSDIAELWPTCKLVHGRARHSESQGGVERLNQTVQRRLAAWRKDNKDASWARVGIKVVQWGINTVVTKATDKVPYEYVFGQPPMCGLSDLPLSVQLIQNLKSEDDIEAAVDKVTKAASKAKTGTSAKAGSSTAGFDAKDHAAARELLCDNEDMLAVFDSLPIGTSMDAKRLLARILALSTSTNAAENSLAFAVRFFPLHGRTAERMTYCELTVGLL